MILSNTFDAFGDFLPISWVDRGVVTDSAKVKPSRPAPKPVRPGLNLFRFLQVGIAALTVSAPTHATPLPVDDVGGHTNAYTTVSIPSQVPRQSGSGLTLTADPQLFRFESDLSNYRLGTAAHSYTVKSQVSSIDALSQETMLVIGPNGVSRLQQFLRLPAGWDSGQGLPLSARSLSNFDGFMRSTRIAPPRACVFMTHQGYVVLNWLDTENHVTELEFKEDEISLFSEVSGNEVVFALHQSAELKKLLQLPDLQSGVLV